MDKPDEKSNISVTPVDLERQRRSDIRERFMALKEVVFPGSKTWVIANAHILRKVNMAVGSKPGDWGHGD